MNYLTKLPVLSKQQICMIMLLMATSGTIGANVGYQVSESKHTEVQHFDVFKYKAYSEIAPYMQNVVNHPSRYNLVNVKNKINIVYRGWENDQQVTNKAFDKYLDSCVDVVTCLQTKGHPGLQQKVDLMNTAYSNL
jgi:hypothetical protein